MLHNFSQEHRALNKGEIQKFKVIAMAKKKFNQTVTRAVTSIQEWCNQYGYTIIPDGDYAIYMTISKNKSDVKNDLLNLLMYALDVSKKKLNSLISILTTGDRVYIFFKKKMHAM